MLDLLLVEDDPALRDVLSLHFAAEGWGVRVAETGEAALACCAERLPDLVVLDVMLPERSGLEVCAALRALYHPSPGVVIVSARDSEIDIIIGLEVGADDYVVKPCRPREVTARVKALVRRLDRGSVEAPPVGTAKSDVIVHGALRIEPSARAVTVRGSAVKLTPSEYALLLYLARAPAQVFGRLEILEHVFDSTNESYARNVDSHVKRLRRKLELAGLTPAPIRTVHGSGYSWGPVGESTH